MTDFTLRQHSSVPASHFETLYANSDDPWAYLTSAFEAGKRRKTLDALGDRKFDKGLELGCSIGVLTAELAPYCGVLTGVDGSKAACDLARRHLASFSNVDILQARIPENLEQLKARGELDLIVLSEVLYFFSPDDLRALCTYVVQALAPGGLCVVVNFDGDTQAGFSGIEAAALFSDLTRDSLKPTLSQTNPGFQVLTFVRLTSDGTAP